MDNLNLEQKRHIVAFLSWCAAMDDEFADWIYENGGYMGWLYG